MIGYMKMNKKLQENDEELAGRIWKEVFIIYIKKPGQIPCTSKEFFL